MAYRISLHYLLILGVLSATMVDSSAAPRKAEGIDALPTPWVVAHRGGPLLWPEATMEAYQASTAAGNQFVEVDCIELIDGAVGVIHDEYLDRVTTSKGKSALLNSAQWVKLQVDGQRLLGPGWGKYPVPFLDEILVRYGNRKIIFAEAKTQNSGRAIVNKLKQFRIDRNWVVVNSFIPEELRAAKAAGYKTCLNLQNMVASAKTLKNAGYWGVTCPFPVTEKYIQSLKAVGLKVLAYTINRHYQRDRFLAWGVDGFYTDDPLYMDMKGGFRSITDPFSKLKWSTGMLPGLDGDRGFFVAPNKWAINAAQENKFKGCLQGWMSPIGGKPYALEWSIEFSITFRARFRDDRWASVSIFDIDAPLDGEGTSDLPIYGFHFLFHNTGNITIFRYSGITKDSGKHEKTVTGPKIEEGETVVFRITTATGKITAERVDGKAVLVLQDNTYRGAYVTFGAKGQYAEFSNVRLHTL